MALPDPASDDSQVRARQDMLGRLGSASNLRRKLPIYTRRSVNRHGPAPYLLEEGGVRDDPFRLARQGGKNLVFERRQMYFTASSELRNARSDSRRCSEPQDGHRQIARTCRRDTAAPRQ